MTTRKELLEKIAYLSIDPKRERYRKISELTEKRPVDYLKTDKDVLNEISAEQKYINQGTKINSKSPGIKKIRMKSQYAQIKEAIKRISDDIPRIQGPKVHIMSPHDEKTSDHTEKADALNFLAHKGVIGFGSDQYERLGDPKYKSRLKKKSLGTGVTRFTPTKKGYKGNLGAKIQDKLHSLQEQRIAKEHNHSIQFRYAKASTYDIPTSAQKVGKYWKYWLLNAKQTNGNGWGVSDSTIRQNIAKFKNRPFVITAKQWIDNSQYGDQFEHPYVPTNNLDIIFQHQAKFAVGTIRKIIEEGDDFYAMIEPLALFASRTPPPFCSPAIFQLDPREPENAITKWEALHLAGLDSNPAYGAMIANLKGTCIGTENECTVQFRGAKSVDDFASEVRDRINPFRQYSISEKDPQMHRYDENRPLAKEVPYGKRRSYSHNRKQGASTGVLNNVVHNKKIRPRKPKQRDFAEVITAKIQQLTAGSNEVVQAFHKKQSGKSGNYSTDGRSFFLFKNEIARHSPKGLMVSNAGYDTDTTYRALRQLGVNIKVEGTTPMLNGKPYSHGKFMTVPYDTVNPVSKPVGSSQPRPRKGFDSNEGLQKLRAFADTVRKRDKGLSQTSIQPEDQKLINKITGVKSPIGKPVKATAIHHILYKKKVPGMAFNPNNGIALDRKSHVMTHKLDSLKAKLKNAKQRVAAYPVKQPHPVKINPEHGRIIADQYEQMKHDPGNPHVKASYDALIKETGDQFKHLLKGGLKITKITPGVENPYPNSKIMHEDVEKNNHLHYFPTEGGFGQGEKNSDHPMLQPTEFKHNGQPMLANDVFRIVHDINGHHLGGKTGFGPTGEHQAYEHHKTMYSKAAHGALTTETMGQNNWVNFSRSHGEKNRADPKNTTYAEQKAGLLPEHIINGRYHQ